jgi:hypothetical protein
MFSWNSGQRRPPLEPPIVREKQTSLRDHRANTPIKIRPSDNNCNRVHDSAIQARSIGICFSMRIIVEMRLKTGSIPNVWLHRQLYRTFSRVLALLPRYLEVLDCESIDGCDDENLLIATRKKETKNNNGARRSA